MPISFITVLLDSLVMKVIFDTVIDLVSLASSRDAGKRSTSYTLESLHESCVCGLHFLTIACCLVCLRRRSSTLFCDQLRNLGMTPLFSRWMGMGSREQNDCAPLDREGARGQPPKTLKDSSKK